MKQITGRMLFPAGVQWEQRAKPTSMPSPDSDYWFETSYTSKSGIDVNQDNALTYSTVWACVKVISEDIASLPLITYRRDGDGKSRAVDNPAYYLLHDAPNDEMSAMQFREALQAHLLLWGNAYAQIIWNLRGEPKSLWPLNPGNMKVKRTKEPPYDLDYEYTTSAGDTEHFTREEILHVAGLGFNGLIGYSPISYQREAVANGLSAQEYQATNMKNGGRLQVAFVHPAPVAPKPEARKQFKKELREEYGGQSGQRIGVFWEGMEPKPIGMSLEDQQFLDSRKFTRSEICAIFRVPPHKIADLERATFSNIEQQSISYVIDAIRPWAVRWEQAINQRLLGGSSKFYVEHLVDGLLRGDIASRYAAYAVAKQWGWLNSDEIRTFENMNPIPSGKGQIYLQPLNMVEAGAKPPAPQSPPVEPTADNEDVQRMAREITRHLQLIRSK